MDMMKEFKKLKAKHTRRIVSNGEGCDCGITVRGFNTCIGCGSPAAWPLAHMKAANEMKRTYAWSIEAEA
jgi:hypothetical protein